MTYRFGVMSDFSISQSLLTIKKIAKLAIDKKYKAIVVSDTMTVSAMPTLSNLLAGSDVKTLFSVTVGVYDDPTYRVPPKRSGIAPKNNFFCHLKLYAKNQAGIKEIFKLLTVANTEERFYYVPRCGVDDILALENVVISSGSFFGLFSHPHYKKIAEKLKAKFGDDFVIEISPVDSPLFDQVNIKAYQWGVTNNCEFLVTLPAMYESDAQITTLNVSKAIYTNTQISADKACTLQLQKTKGLVLDCDSNALRERLNAFIERVDMPEMHAQLDKFEELPERWINEYAYTFEKKAPCLPKMAENEYETLVLECVEGWKKRLMMNVLGYKPSPEQTAVYKERLRYELGILKKMNFSGYFLLVQDLVRHCKENGIYVGPARGSSAGSLVAFLMGITDIDPIRFNLFFERFINPSRIDLPDIDMDYQSTKRQDVIDYLVNKYGEDRVAGISNYQTLGAASAIRDTGRVFGVPTYQLDVSKLMPKDHGISLSLEEAAKTVPDIAEFRTKNPALWNHALNLEGVMRNLGRHAAGTVVAGEPLVERASVETRAGSPVVNWDKRIVEDMGLIKMDILGLSTLDTLQIAKEYIKATRGTDIVYTELPLDDIDTLEAFGRGETTGIFQFESAGMKKLLKDLANLNRLTFEDITAATALFRPGPMDSGLLNQYVRIKQGLEEASYDHPSMKNALESTYGVMVYQEQSMQVARDFAGFTMAEADLLRKAMGKKDVNKMKAMRSKFIEGAVKNSGVSETLASEVFEKIEKFAGYGFNKSHAVAYSVISYWTCYLRVHYPAEYFAACLSIIADDKYEEVIKDARECDIEVLPPQINHSTDKFVIYGKNKILAPLSAVKFISETISRKIMKLRRQAGGKFKTKEQFFEMASEKGSGVNTRACNNLGLVGAYDEIDEDSRAVSKVERIKHQKTLMGGLILDAVKATRETEITDELKSLIKQAQIDWMGCVNCSLCDGNHCKSAMSTLGKIKFMLVTDCPNWDDDAKGRFMASGKVSKNIVQLMKDHDIDYHEGYYTGVVKVKKDDKYLAPEQINKCSKFLDREVEIIKPSVVIALGTAAIRKFIPDAKSATEMNGKAIYLPEKDMTVVCGLSPSYLTYDMSKWKDFNALFATVKTVLN